MSIELLAVNKRQLSWLAHPLNRFLAGRAANRLASSMRQQNLSVAFVDQLRSPRNDRDVSRLRRLGIYQIQVKGAVPKISITNGYLDAQAWQAAAPQYPTLTFFALAANPDDLVVERTFAVMGRDKPQKVSLLFAPSPTTAFNISPLPKATSFDVTYYGPGRIVGTSRTLPLEGELSLFAAAETRPTLRYDRRQGDLGQFTTGETSISSIIIKDETKPSTALGIASALMGGTNFGVRRLYHLVYDNARFLLASLAHGAVGQYTVFLGKSNRYLKFFGQPMVGDKTLAEVTAESNPPQYMILTKPLSIRENEQTPKQVALVDKKTGKVKYVLPATLWAAHVDNLKKKMGAKFAAGMRSAELAEALELLPILNPEQAQQLAVFKELVKQKDVWETEWVFMEVVPGSFVADKAWLQRLNSRLAQLSEEFQRSNAGKTMARILREYGNKYNLEDLVYLVMFTSDRGDFTAGFVGKFPELKGLIDPKYLARVYAAIREEIFVEDGKIYAINLGEATEVISFSDEKEGKTGQQLRKGEYNYTRVMTAAVTWNRDSREEWLYWRQALDLPTTARASIRDSFIGDPTFAQRLNLPYVPLIADLPLLWRLFPRHDQIIIDSSLSSNYRPKGPCIIIGSDLRADEPTVTHGMMMSVWSRAQLTSRLNRKAGGTLLYHLETIGPAAGEGYVGAPGLYAMYSTREPLAGSGLMARTAVLVSEYPTPGDEAAVTTTPQEITKRQAPINDALGKVSADSNAVRETLLLERVLEVIGRGGR